VAKLWREAITTAPCTLRARIHRGGEWRMCKLHCAKLALLSLLGQGQSFGMRAEDSSAPAQSRFTCGSCFCSCHCAFVATTAIPNKATPVGRPSTQVDLGQHTASYAGRVAGSDAMKCRGSEAQTRMISAAPAQAQGPWGH